MKSLLPKPVTVVRWIRGLGSVLGDHRDLPDDVVVEVIEFVGGHPQLDQLLAAGRVRFESPDVAGVHVEASHVADRPVALVLGVPLSGDAGRLAFREHGVEDRLPVEALREPAPAAGLD